MKVLLFLREEICNGLINEYIRRLSKGLNACGIETDFYDISRYLLTPPPESELRNWPEKHYDAALAFNAIGQQNYMLDGENIYDRMGIPFYNYLLDHPLEHDPDVAMGPADYRIICLDRDHVDYVYKYYPNVKKCYFLPLPGV
nr:hypothetical protein [Lachnospiraceae bacterium]